MIGPIKVSRSIKELGIKIRELQKEYLNKKGKEINIDEIVKELKVSKEDIVLALEATKSVESIEASAYSNNSDDKDINLLDKISNNKDEEEILTNKIAINELIKDLDKREQKIILLRFFKEKTQSEVSKILGITQVQVSRIERKILNNMKMKLIS